MRKTMMLATALLAACGSVSAPKGDDTGSGSDGGSGSGSGVVDTSCTTAADCGPGMACATDTHQCVAAAFTLDKAGFYDDGTRWWTSTDAPTLHGTIDDAGGQSLDAFIGGTKVGSATIDGTTWSIELPAGSIKATDTAVTLKLGTLEQNQTFALDNAVPTITLFGSVKDERGDAIDFTTGEPVHTHNGAAIDLTGTGCPAVYKYAYLMDATKPMYGREVTPNPFVWQVKASDATPLDSMDSAYRVRDDAGRVLYDWTSISPDATGVYNVALYRNDMPELGTYAGKIHMDVRFRDAFGNEAVRDTCWDNHPLAVPVSVSTAQPSTLFGWTLPADSPISQLLMYTVGADVYSQHIVQYAGEPVALQLTSITGVHYTRVASDHFAITGTTTATFTCDLNDCGSAPPTDPADVTETAALTNNQMFWTSKIIDEATGNVIATDSGNNLTFSLPARANGAQPHSYRVDVRLGVLGAITPPKRSALENVTLGEYTVNSETYTGWNPQAGPTDVCNHKACHVTSSGTVCGCTAANVYSEVRAIKSLRIDFDAFTEQLSAGPSANALVPVTYPGTALHVAAASWNAGTDNLPQ